MGYIVLEIWDAIPVTESYEWTSSGRLLDWTSNSRAAIFYEDLSDEIAEVYMTQTSFEEQVWQLFFDSASRMGPTGKHCSWNGVVFLSPQNYMIPRAFSLTKPCSNNVKEYNVFLIGMQLAEEIGVKNLEAYGDSKFIVN